MLFPVKAFAGRTGKGCDESSLCAAAPSLLHYNRQCCTVVSVGAGDMVRVSEGSRRITVRLACIDAPEPSQRPWGARSTALLKQLTPVGSDLTLRVQTTDRYGRTVAELITHRGNVNQLLVGAGQAFAYRPSCSLPRGLIRPRVALTCLKSRGRDS